MGYIKPHIVDKIYEASDTKQVLDDYVKLQKKGANFVGKSPFTDEKTGSFTYSPAKGIWKDFSSGKGGNNAVSFLMAKEQVSYVDALEMLAKKFSVTVEYDNSDWAKEHHEQQIKKEDLRPVLESTIRKYEEAFQKLPQSHPAKQEVFEKRGYTQATAEKYRIGYAPKGGSFLYEMVAKVGRLEDAKELGLISEKTAKDKWQNRVIYPLIERKGTSFFAVGLAGRKLDTNKKFPKWLNSKDSLLYKKETYWFGMDKAREQIVKAGEAWLVEGYNDVISWQENGILNTIASCGTAIARKQMRILKKLCDKVVLCFDPDSAGREAMLRYIPEFIRLGFRVQIVELNPAVDPDDFIRFWKNSNIKYSKETVSTPNKREWEDVTPVFSLEDLGTNQDYRDDGFKFMMEEAFKGKDEIEIAQEAKELTQLITFIEDEAMRSIYTDWLQKESKVKKTDLNKWMKAKTEVQEFLRPEQDEFYRIPKVVKEPLEKLRPIIERYQLFQANDQIWVQNEQGPPYGFTSVSNFSIDVIQHMEHEKSPMKLVRIRNIFGHERVFDMISSDLNTLQAFENAVTNHGNFRWKGGRKEHEILKTYLFDRMGTGRKIDVLGWQPEGFWAWNNKVDIPGAGDIMLDENGVFDYQDVSYYVPSANQIYRKNLYKYEAQKKIICKRSQASFQNLCIQIEKVHRTHGILGILFSVASIFQDVVVSNINSFPMLFLYGPASSGKDQLADVCQNFFGNPQTAINLEGGISTAKAQIREFAQISNMISQLSEYKNGDPKLDGMLKGLWDRRGYKRGTLDSHVSSESIPILSSVIMTGNYAPDQEALITRLIWCVMDKTTFTDQEDKNYQVLSDMVKHGISGFTSDFLNHRAFVEENFKNQYRNFKTTLAQRRPEANSRMIQNLSVLGTFYQMFNDKFSFSFNLKKLMEIFEDTIDTMMNKMTSASIINRWWDCWLSSMRGSIGDQLRVRQDFKVEGDKVYFNFTSCYNRIQRQWFSQYKDNAPGKGIMQDALQKDKAWVSKKNSERLAPGRDARSTSVYIVSLNELPIADELMLAVDFQLNESSLFDNPDTNGQISMSQPPATPNKEKNGREPDDLPF